LCALTEAEGREYDRWLLAYESGPANRRRDSIPPRRCQPRWRVIYFGLAASPENASLGFSRGLAGSSA